MNIAFHPDAAVELAAHSEWYDVQEPGLGIDFELAVYDAVEVISAHPEAWPAWEGLDIVRFYPMARFPFLLPYIYIDGQVVVLAVAHERRTPGYWSGRI